MKLSVIIPAYNCGDTIGPTLDALQAQTFSDWEAVIVNDGSTDGTPAVLEQRAARDPRLRILTTPNAGPAHARNTGIEQARGEYLCFLDSDDLPLPEMYGRLVEFAEANSLDAAVCGYWMEDVGGSRSVRTEFSSPGFVAASPQELAPRIPELITAHLMYVVWNKCFRTAFLRENGIRFESFRSGEDRLFNFACLPRFRRFGCIRDPLYRYLIRRGESLASRWVPDRLDAALRCHEALQSAYEGMGLLADPNNLASLEFQFVKLAVSCLTQLSARGCPLSRSEKRAETLRILRHPAVQNAARYPCGGYSRLVNAVLRTQNPLLARWMAGGIRLLETRLHPLYLRLKRSA